MKHLQSILLLILMALAGGHTVSFGQTALASVGGESGAQANASATISDAERQKQVQLNHAFAHEFVLTYDHIPDHLEYTNDNYNKPVAERTIDNEDITPLTWKWVKLEMPEPGGSVMTACLRRPQWWLTAHQADVPGNWVAISLPEMGIHGKAQVKELAPSYVDTRFADFQTDGGQKYRPITGWFERRAPEVWQYVFTSGDTIGATPNHPFYSEDRQTYLPADALQTGERVKLASRQTAALLSKWKLETSSEVVYNLEVWRDHNFYVGENGVLVHNSCLVEYLNSFFPTWTRMPDPDKTLTWVDYLKESNPGKLFERQQLQRLGEFEQERMIALSKTVDRQDFPGIDGISDSGRPISLKNVTALSIETLKDRIEEIGVGATNAKNATLPQLVDIDGMVTASEFTQMEIIAAINDVVANNKSDMSIVKKIFIEGTDGASWYELPIPD
ncbi:MAG TPA: Hint domain-containing protein [Saprospiraceae bacterium]|nr:Hint domain-containing protein [Saprospiraceae bacterium]